MFLTKSKKFFPTPAGRLEEFSSCAFPYIINGFLLSQISYLQVTRILRLISLGFLFIVLL